MRLRHFPLILLVTFSMCLGSAAAQDIDSASNSIQADSTPPHIEFVDGEAMLERDGRLDAVEMTAPLLAGDRVRTDAGRLEILMGDGSALYLAEETTIDLLSESRLRLIEGRLTLIVARRANARAEGTDYQIDTPVAEILIDGPGEYRVSGPAEAGMQETELAVVRGSARLVTEAGEVALGAGERSVAREGTAPGAVGMFNSARWDDFDRWTNDRQAGRVSAVSSRYLPSEVESYAATLDRYGTWSQMADYGYVWYPTAAASGWRPYYNGYWGAAGIYGWNWIGYDPWAWPTHHYGRWGFRNSAWFWIPGSVWGPGWVNWGVAPGFVSWCPLGFNGQPVTGFWNVGVGFVSLHSPWSAWTVIPRQGLGTRRAASSIAVDGRTLANNPRAAFILQQRPPFPLVREPRSIERGRAAEGGRVGAQRATSAIGTVRSAGPRSDGSGAPRSGGQGIHVDQSPRGTLSVIGGRTAERAGIGTREPARSVGTGPVRPIVSADPFDRAARVAATRAPGNGHQPLRSAGDGVGISSRSPYPTRFQSPGGEPFRYVPISPMGRGSMGGVYEHRGAPVYWPTPSSSGGRPSISGPMMPAGSRPSGFQRGGGGPTMNAAPRGGGSMSPRAPTSPRASGTTPSARQSTSPRGSRN